MGIVKNLLTTKMFLKQTTLLSLLLIGLSQTACARCSRTAEAPPEYYQAADHKQGRELKVALGQIARQHTVFSYGELWYRYEFTDVVPGTENQVFDYYSPEVHYFTGTGVAATGMNKEHACPQSWWGKGAQCGAYSDLFNVMPSEEGANSAKSNFPVGVVSSAHYSNGHMQTGPSARPEYDGSVFEPCDDFKGDFARIYFYIATTYSDAAWGSQTTVAKTCPFLTQDYPTIQSWLLPLLLQWNAQDPVSEWEVTRNERVFLEQGNRNPFVDYPQLADYIWGDSIDHAFDFAQAVLHGSASGQMADGLYHGEGSGSGTGTGGGDDVEPVTPVEGYLLYDDFASAPNGDHTTNSGSSSAWTGDAVFPTVTTTFQAGGAVKLGSGKATGVIESCPMTNQASATLVVELDVKGWTTVEGALQVEVTGCDPQTLSYTHTMGEGFEHLRVTFTHCPAQARLRISTTAKRAFIDNVRVSEASGDAICAVYLNPEQSAKSYTLQGCISPRDHRGITIVNSKPIFIY